LVIIYTVSGGTKAVSVTQKQQMFIIMLGMFFAFFFIMGALPTDLSFGKALKIAGANNKLNILDFSFDTNNRYTVWSGITGGFFLALAYFGTDQSQVQRYLSGRSVRESQLGLIFNGVFKIPMQFFILLVGTMVFVFYQYNSSPLNFNPAATEAVLQSDYANDYQALENDHKELEKEKRMAQHSFSAALELKEYNAIEQAKQDIVKINEKEKANRATAKTLISKADDTVETNDKDYVFIHFILNNLPMGLIGLLLAVILSAAMSSTASELNALGTITALDLYKRSIKKEESQEHYVKATKVFTLVWGIIAIIIANVANLFDNLIQLVNIIGSIFYGNVLGIFLLAFFFKYVKGNAVFVAAIVTQVIVIIGWYFDWMSYLWLNAFGCLLVILLAFITQIFDNFLGNSTAIDE
jgi:Na+/proline symporter